MRDLPERFNAAAFFVDRHLAEGRGGRTAFRFAGRAISDAEHRVLLVQRSRLRDGA